MDDNKHIQISLKLPTSSNNIDGHDIAGAKFPRYEQVRTFKGTRAHIIQSRLGQHHAHAPSAI
jgi:hypothetical protein